MAGMAGTCAALCIGNVQHCASATCTPPPFSRRFRCIHIWWVYPLCTSRLLYIHKQKFWEQLSTRKHKHPNCMACTLRSCTPPVRGPNSYRMSEAVNEMDAYTPGTTTPSANFKNKVLCAPSATPCVSVRSHPIRQTGPRQCQTRHGASKVSMLARTFAIRTPVMSNSVITY